MKIVAMFTLLRQLKQRQGYSSAINLFRDVERRRSIHSPIPVFTSDNWDPFEEGLVNVYGYLEAPHYNGIGRKPLSVLIPYLSLKYAQVWNMLNPLNLTSEIDQKIYLVNLSIY